MEIPKAIASDFQKATERVYRSSSVTLLLEGIGAALNVARQGITG